MVTDNYAYYDGGRSKVRIIQIPNTSEALSNFQNTNRTITVGQFQQTNSQSCPSGCPLNTWYSWRDRCLSLANEPQAQSEGHYGRPTPTDRGSCTQAILLQGTTDGRKATSLGHSLGKGNDLYTARASIREAESEDSGLPLKHTTLTTLRHPCRFLYHQTFALWAQL